MGEGSNNNSNGAAPLQVPMPHVVRFIRQLSHDLRNHLNAVELQAAYMKEAAVSAEAKSEVQRLREMFSQMGSSLQKLTSTLAEVKLTLMPYGAAAFLEDLRAKLESQFPELTNAVQWKIDLGEAQIEIDPQIMQQAFLELFANAFQHDRDQKPIQANAERSGGDFIFTLREPKTQFAASTENWGREPFGRVMHGHYGLGLHRARSIIEAHHGRYDAQYDSASASLVTTVTLPLLAA
ncbi:MAG: sensor histidine kinase [Chthoniobacterales bacterium]